MATKLFIGSLSWNTTADSLRDAFASFGEITECTVVSDRETGRSRGFGFVSYADADGAERAKNEMDGKPLDGRTIRVDFARERERGGGGGGGRREWRDRR